MQHVAAIMARCDITQPAGLLRHDWLIDVLIYLNAKFSDSQTVFLLFQSTPIRQY